MKQISEALQAHLNGEVQTLATCWAITRRDGVVMGFSDCDILLEIDGVSYEPSTGFSRTAIDSSTRLNVDNMDIEGMLASGSLVEADIISGVYDYARIDVSYVNYADLSQGQLHLRTGWLGEIIWDGQQFVAEVRGLTQPLTASIGHLFSPTCRAQLGDGACGVDLSGYRVSGTVTTVISQFVFMDASRVESSGLFSFGALRFTSGANNGVSAEVKSFQAGQFVLSLPLPFAVETGDAYDVVQGCDKQFSTCMQRFGNAVNFRGEPHIPGMDNMLRLPSSRDG